jgi:hypothetical protein
MKRLIIFVYIIYCFSLSCSDKFGGKYLSKVLESASKFDLDTSKDWKFEVNQIMPDGWRYIELAYVEGDTTKVLMGTFEEIDNEFHFVSSRLDITIMEGTLKKRIILQSPLDTLYIYKYPIANPEKITFDKGKYTYQYDFSELNKGQQIYYELNKDSLDTLRGNYLPELPELQIRKTKKSENYNPVESPAF